MVTGPEVVPEQFSLFGDDDPAPAVPPDDSAAPEPPAGGVIPVPGPVSTPDPEPPASDGPAVAGWSPGMTGKKVHFYPEDGTSSLCGKGGEAEGERTPDDGGLKTADQCAACYKRVEVRRYEAAQEARDRAPKPVRPMPTATHARLRQDVCRSTVHADERVRATIHGLFIHPTDDDLSRPSVYCGWCAWLLDDLMFEADTMPVLCQRCAGGYVPPGEHNPCCDRPAPHGVPLCCPCYAVTHSIPEGEQCH